MGSFRGSNQYNKLTFPEDEAGAFRRSVSLREPHTSARSSNYYSISPRQFKYTYSRNPLTLITNEIITVIDRYINDLHIIKINYIPHLKSIKDPQLVGQYPYVFGNIDRIHTGTRHMYNCLLSCENDHEKIAQIFLHYQQSLYSLYTPYLRNYEKSKILISGVFKKAIKARQKELTSSSDLAHLLYTPLKHLVDLQLLLNRLITEGTKFKFPVDNCKKAFEMLKFEIHKADGLVATDSIMNKPFPLKSNTYLFRNNFFLVKLRKVPVTLFLFEGCIVITQRNQKDLAEYLFKECINMEEVGITCLVDHPKRFCLTSFNLKRNKYEFEAHEGTESEAVKKKWVENIEKLLWKQLNDLKEQAVKNQIFDEYDYGKLHCRG